MTASRNEERIYRAEAHGSRPEPAVEPKDLELVSAISDESLGDQHLDAALRALNIKPTKRRRAALRGWLALEGRTAGPAYPSRVPLELPVIDLRERDGATTIQERKIRGGYGTH